MKKISFIVLNLILSCTLLFGNERLPQYQRLAIFWNPHTAVDPDAVPHNYKRPAAKDGLEYVGQYSDSKPFYEIIQAPEIGKSALKLFLTALDPAVNYDKMTTLDTAGIKESVRDKSGVVPGASPAVLPNVRIYSMFDTLTLDSIIEDFSGELPEAVVIVNAGEVISREQLQRMSISKLLYDARKIDINTLFIGSATTPFISAVNYICEENGEASFIPIKGIDKSVTLSPYSGSLLFHYNFCNDMNADGSSQDSVLFGYDGSQHTIHKVSEVVYANGEYTYKKGQLLYAAVGNLVQTNLLLIDKSMIVHHWGQFLIEGIKMVQPITHDGDNPAMNSGLYYESSVLKVTADKKLAPVRDLTADNIEGYTDNTIHKDTPIIEAGTAVPYGSTVNKLYLKVRESNGTLTSTGALQNGTNVKMGGIPSEYDNSFIPLVKETAAWVYPPMKGHSGEDATQFFKPANGSAYEYEPVGMKIDGVTVEYAYKLQAGDKVVIWSVDKNWQKLDSIGYFEVETIESDAESYQFTFQDDFKINNKILYHSGDVLIVQDSLYVSYPKTGYNTLSMDMIDIPENGNEEIFTKIFQTSTLQHDEKVEFKDWSDNGRIACEAEIWAFDDRFELATYHEWLGNDEKFDAEKYYVGTLGQQFARGEKQFAILTQNEQHDGFDSTTFDILPNDTKVGIKDKEYPILTVGRHGHYQFGIIGYQPQYVKDIEKSIAILSDMTSWIAHNTPMFPRPDLCALKGNTVYTAGDTLPTDVEKLCVVVDFTSYDQDVYNEGYSFTCNLQYPLGTVVKSLSLADVSAKKTVAGKNIDSLFFDISSIIDPTQTTKTDLKIAEAKIEPAGGNIGSFVSSFYESAYWKLPKLVATFVGTTTDFLVTADVEVKSDSFIAGSGAVSSAKVLPSGTPTIVINHSGNIADEGPSTHKVTISETQTVKAFAKMDGYINSDEITRAYTKGSLTFPVPLNSVSEDSILFVTDTIALEVVLSGELQSYNAKYKIEWAVEYDGAEVLTGLGAENSKVKIAVGDVIDRSKVSATAFKVKGKTVSQDVANFNSSKDTTYLYGVKKLKTDPATAANVNFTGSTSLTIKGLCDLNEIATSSIIYTFDTSTESMKSGESTKEFTQSVDLTFWAEDPAYINSDTVKGYHFELVDTKIPTLPTPLVTPVAEDVNDKGEYIFAKSSPLHITLSQFTVDGKELTNDDYRISYKLLNSPLTQEDTGFVVLPTNCIDSLCYNGYTQLTVTAQTVSTDHAQWNSSAIAEVQTYDFRKVSVTISTVSEEADTVVVTVAASDPVTGTALDDCLIYYTFDGTTPTTSSSKIEAGKGIRVPKGSILKVLGDCQNYIDGTAQAVLTKESLIVSDPESGTYFGEELEVTLTSNFSPIHYSIDGGEKSSIESTSGSFLLDDKIPTIIEGDDTVKVHVWVDDVTVEGVVQKGTSKELVFYRRKLPKVEITPEGGVFSAEHIDIVMAIPAGAGAVYYSLDGSQPDITHTQYTTPFVVTLDTTIIARAFAKDWLPSDTTMVSYVYQKSDTTIISADFNKDNVIDESDFALLSTYWYNSAKKSGPFTELAPDKGDFGKPLIQPDQKFDYLDLNRFVQYCYWYEAQGQSGNRSLQTGTKLEGLRCRAYQRDSEIIVSISLDSVENLLAATCEINDVDDVQWRSGSLLKGNGDVVSAVLDTRFVQSRVSQNSATVNGSGDIALATLPKNIQMDSVSINVRAVFDNGQIKEGTLRIPVEANGVSLTIAPNPFSAGEKTTFILRSKGAPIHSFLLSILDINGQEVYSQDEQLSYPLNMVSVPYNGQTSWNRLLASGSYLLVVECKLEDGDCGKVQKVLGVVK